MAGQALAGLVRQRGMLTAPRGVGSIRCFHYSLRLLLILLFLFT